MKARQDAALETRFKTKSNFGVKEGLATGKTKKRHQSGFMQVSQVVIKVTQIPMGFNVICKPVIRLDHFKGFAAQARHLSATSRWDQLSALIKNVNSKLVGFFSTPSFLC